MFLYFPTHAHHQLIIIIVIILRRMDLIDLTIRTNKDNQSEARLKSSERKDNMSKEGNLWVGENDG